jgi:hypothetical protein
MSSQPMPRVQIKENKVQEELPLNSPQLTRQFGFYDSER